MSYKADLFSGLYGIFQDHLEKNVEINEGSKIRHSKAHLTLQNMALKK